MINSNKIINGCLELQLKIQMGLTYLVGTKFRKDFWEKFRMKFEVKRIQVLHRVCLEY